MRLARPEVSRTIEAIISEQGQFEHARDIHPGHFVDRFTTAVIGRGVHYRVGAHQFLERGPHVRDEKIAVTP
jgi:hypothetical protein